MVAFMAIWELCPFRGWAGLGRRSEAEQTVTASKLHSLSSHLDIKGGRVRDSPSWFY